MGSNLNNSLSDNYISNGIKVELVSWEEECSDCTINPLTEQIQGTDPSTDTMGSNLNNSLSIIIYQMVLKRRWIMGRRMFRLYH
ncbi:hypothetical protein GDO86_020056 [Hymenochirus boettgeri]|uniref:Uncharacterized protein n=1 Tax=Hymenochirus boettgeri TaxID=247094 RepID=A0A8T2IFP4_9PIPI|nr:hypothetical protein GDO86_020056 [Hymenochirus boettgeri]